MSDREISPELRAALAKMAKQTAMLNNVFFGREPRHRWFRNGAGPKFGWYTEAPTEGGHAGKYASFVYVPVGPGSRSGKATKWRYVEEAESWHALRKDARARALKLLRAWQAGDPTPWK